MKKRVSLTVAISDTSVSTALVVRDPSADKPTIVSYRSKSFNPEHRDITLEYLESRLAILLRAVIKETRYKDLVSANISVGNIKNIVVSLSAPWFEGKTVTSHFSESKEFKITKKILESSLDAEIKAISGNDKDKITILESCILSSTINGYNVQDPIGKTAQSVSLFGYVSYAKTSIFNLIHNVLKDYFHHTQDALIKSEPTILFTAALDEAEKRNLDNDFVIVRVNEILTHVQIIRDKHIKEHGTIPIGLNSILREISQAFSITLEVALNILDLYGKNKLEKNYAQKISTILTKVLEKWGEGVKEFSTSTIDSGRFPSHVFLSSPTSISSALSSYLSSDDYLDITMSEKNLTVDVLDRVTLNAFLNVDKSVTIEPGFLTKLSALIE